MESLRRNSSRMVSTAAMLFSSPSLTAAGSLTGPSGSQPPADWV